MSQLISLIMDAVKFVLALIGYGILFIFVLALIDFLIQVFVLPTIKYFRGLRGKRS